MSCTQCIVYNTCRFAYYCLSFPLLDGLCSRLGLYTSTRRSTSMIPHINLFYEFIILTLVLNIMICRYYDPNTYIFPDYSKKFLGLANVLFIPMWLFIASGLAVYISLALHIIVSHQNIRHILHSIVSWAIPSWEILHKYSCMVLMMAYSYTLIISWRRYRRWDLGWTGDNVKQKLSTWAQQCLSNKYK